MIEKISMSLPLTYEITEIDPANIRMTPEYEINAHLHSRLVDLSHDGATVSALANKISNNGDTITFHLSKSATAGGQKITPQDVKSSFERLSFLNSNTHGKLDFFLDETKSIEESSDRNSVTFFLKKGRSHKDFLRMLTSVDFSIIPTNSIDTKTNRIINLTETFGLYHLLKIDQNNKSHFTLTINKNHINYKNIFPKEIEIVPSLTQDSSIELFQQGKVDWIPRTDRVNPVALSKFIKENRDRIFVDQTLPFHLIMVKFTRRGIKELSIERRISIGKILKKFYRSEFKDVDGALPSDQIIPPGGSGGLTKSELKEVSELFASTDANNEKGKGVLIAAPALQIEVLKKLQNTSLPLSQLKEVVRIPALPDQQGMTTNDPHLFIGGIDVVFDGSIPGFSYFFRSEIFQLNASTSIDQWVSEYLEADSTKRLQKLHDINLNTVRSITVVPLNVLPFFTVVRKPLVANFSKIHPSNGAWNITHP